MSGFEDLGHDDSKLLRVACEPESAVPCKARG